MIVCVVGSGGREHALAQVLGRTADVVVDPGQPGHRRDHGRGPHPDQRAHPGPRPSTPTCSSIGPEAPLVDGLADRLRAQGKLVFGPGADGARLEGSKAFMKELLAEAGVPTARFGAFDDLATAKAFLRTLPGPWVVKTDGLAAGKGVLVTDSLAEAEADVEAKLSGGGLRRRRARRWSSRRVWSARSARCWSCATAQRLAALAPAQDFKRLRRRRRRAQHRRHGGVLAGALRRRRPGRRSGRRGGGPAGGRPPRPGHRLPGRALRRPDAHRRRAQGPRVQRALRRSRDPGGAAPVRRRPGRAAGRGGRRTAARRPPGSCPTPPCAWSWPRRAIRSPPGSATPSTAWTRTVCPRRPRCSTPGPGPGRMAGW